MLTVIDLLGSASTLVAVPASGKEARRFAHAADSDDK
jgi:hypothetical protein